jgi:hypothetical protein
MDGLCCVLRPLVLLSSLCAAAHANRVLMRRAVLAQQYARTPLSGFVCNLVKAPCAAWPKQVLRVQRVYVWQGVHLPVCCAVNVW